MAEEKQETGITFTLDDGAIEVIKIDADGSFYVKGKKVTEDIELYNAFVNFFKDAGYYKKE